MTLNGTLAETIVSALSTDTQFSDITFVVAYENEIKPTPIEKPIVAISVKQCEIGEKLQETLETGEITVTNKRNALNFKCRHISSIFHGWKCRTQDF